MQRVRIGGGGDRASPKSSQESRSTARERSNGGGNYFASEKADLEFISSGCKTLDLALGGGWVEDRIINIVGDKSTGKTLLCIEASANFAIKYPKGKIRYRESEAAFDEAYAQAIGMPIDRVDFGDPMETVEDLFDDLSHSVKNAKQPELFICDSLDALSDRAEMVRDMDQGTYGAEKAKKLSQLFRRLVRDLQEKHVTVIIVSQIRDKIGATFGFGRKTTRTGGRALDFYSSQTVYLAHTGTLSRTVRGQKRPIGIEIKAKLDKNKVALPFREAEFPIWFGYGIDDVTACLTWLKDINALKDVGIADKEVKGYADYLIEGPASEQRAEIKRIHAAVEKRWYEIEQTLLPRRSKYGS